MRLIILFSLLFSTQLLADVEPLPPTVEEPIIHQIYRLVDQRNSSSPIFKQALSSNDLDLQKVALLGLARIGGKSVIEFVLPFLTHKNEELRQLAALAIGISGTKESAVYLWQQLDKESSEIVKKEIYLGLGNLGEDGLVTKMLQRLSLEKSRDAQAALFQGLAMAMTFHRDLKDDFVAIDYKKLISKLSIGDDKAASVGLFLGRIPNVDSYIKAADLLPLTRLKMSAFTTSHLIRLITKVSKTPDAVSRELLAWAIEQSETADLAIQLEATRLIGNFLDTPQALIQIGKLHVSPNPIIAQTALKVIADSDLNTPEVISLLKNQLKSTTPAMLVEAMSGLIKRQNKAEMSWVLQFFAHPSSYVKINLMALLNQKYEQTKEKEGELNNFNNVIKMFSQAPEKDISAYANSLLTEKDGAEETPAKSPAYAAAKEAAGKQLTIKTDIGNIKIQLDENAPFTAWHFINNVQSGYFNGSYFNRVIGNFVAQGGDQIGDGEGSTGKTIREEISFLSHEPMTVGMATAGKDTGSSQFFINTARNLHLDRNYTIFGKVIQGQDIVYAMTHGTQILSIEIEK